MRRTLLHPVTAFPRTARGDARREPPKSSARTAAATAAPLYLGSLAAALQAAEIDKLLSRRIDDALLGREVMHDLRHHSHFLTTLPRNPDCRFDHRTFAIEEAGEWTLEEALALTGDSPEEACLTVDGHEFLAELPCTACGVSNAIWRLAIATREVDLVCAECGGDLEPHAFHARAALRALELPPERRTRPLCELGLRPGEVFGVSGPSGERRFRLPFERGGSNPAGTLFVAGCGNIGSNLLPLVARLPNLARVIIADPDRYEEANRVGQAITPWDVGRLKVAVQAENLRRTHPDLELIAYAERLEVLPLGVFLGAVLVSCLDSRDARLQLNRIAWRVGSPWVDAAVDAERRLARMSVFDPGVNRVCGECGYDLMDYAQLEVAVPCQEFHDAH